MSEERVMVAAAPDRAQELRLLEALIFAAEKPIDEAALLNRLAEGSDLETLLAELREMYLHRGVNLVRVAGGWCFRTASDLAPRLMLERTVSRKLSRAAVETLAIIAYHQPVTRAEIEEIRGVALSRGILDTLMEAGWIRPRGHKAVPGRPAMWVTTEDFLSHFGLDSLTDLPGMDELKAAGLLDSRPGASLGEIVDAPPLETADGDEEEGGEAEDEEIPSDEAGDGEGGEEGEPP